MEYHFNHTISVVLLIFLPWFAIADDTSIQVIQSNNQFGFKVMQAATQLDESPQNRFISPLSMHLALSMTLNGAANETKQQMMGLLGYSPQDSVEQINQQNLLLVQSLAKAPLSDEERAAIPPSKGLPPVFSILNSAWTTNGATLPRTRYEFSDVFLKDLAAFYDVSTPISLDFKASASADVINQWTKEATHGMIPEIIDAQTLGELLWLLVNTTYLEAQWERGFYRLNEMRPFQRLDGMKVPVAMMSRNGEVPVAQVGQTTVVELPLNQSTIKAYLVVPDSPAGFVKLQKGSESIWTEEFWQKAFTNVELGAVQLMMPPFKVKDQVLLVKDSALTKQLGLNFMFQNDTDLTRMDGMVSPPSRVGIIKQNAKVDWNDKGITAAAATIVGGAERTGSPSPIVKVVVDRPFYFALYDQASKSFLFIGQIVVPALD